MTVGQVVTGWLGLAGAYSPSERPAITLRPLGRPGATVWSPGWADPQPWVLRAPGASHAQTRLMTVIRLTRVQTNYLFSLGRILRGKSRWPSGRAFPRRSALAYKKTSTIVHSRYVAHCRGSASHRPQTSAGTWSFVAVSLAPTCQCRWAASKWPQILGFCVFAREVHHYGQSGN